MFRKITITIMTLAIFQYTIYGTIVPIHLLLISVPYMAKFHSRCVTYDHHEVLGIFYMILYEIYLFTVNTISNHEEIASCNNLFS